MIYVPFKITQAKSSKNAIAFAAGRAAEGERAAAQGGGSVAEVALLRLKKCFACFERS